MRPPWEHRGDLPSAPGKSEKWSRHLVGLGFLGFAIPLFVLGMVSLVSSWHAVSGSGRAAGTVVGFRPGGSRTSAPVIRYAVDGTKYEIVAKVSTRPRNYSRGDTVDVRYHPGHPGEGRLIATGELWLFPAVSLALSATFATFAFLTWKYGVESAAAPSPPVDESREARGS